MATELTRRSLRWLVPADAFPMRVPLRAMMTVVALSAMIAGASLIIGIRTASRDESDAQARYESARALLALPVPQLDPLRAQLATAQADLTNARAQVTAITGSSTSEDPSAALVRRAQAASLVVRGLSTVPSSQAKAGGDLYEVSTRRMSVEGTVPRIILFVQEVASETPSLVPGLSTLSVAAGGRATADISFSSYAKMASPTPVAAVATPRPR